MGVGLSKISFPSKNWDAAFFKLTLFSGFLTQAKNKTHYKKLELKKNKKL